MDVVRYARRHDWPVLSGYCLFVGMMATGYYYNITFVQLGLVDLGTRLIGMGDAAVAANMAVFALSTCVVALACGALMQRRGWGERFVVKLRIAFAVVLVQTALTALAPWIRSESLFTAWVLLASGAMGVGVPATFSLSVDLVPVRDRGPVAALITGAAYFVAAVFSSTWRVEAFAAQILPVMLLGAFGLGLLGFGRFAFVAALAAQHALPAFGRGRYAEDESPPRRRIGRGFLVALVAMFAIYFIDSLGFLRIIATPVFAEGAWHSSAPGTLLFIGGTHVVAALIAGVLYTALDRKVLFAWVFGLFALSQMMYVFDLRVAPASSAPLAMTMLYATAVSIYTVINFAVWADLSTPRTIARNAALGVALSGWTATFLSTALSVWWRARGMAVATHLNLVAALALLLFVATLAIFVAQAPGAGMSPQSAPGPGDGDIPQGGPQ